MPPATDLLNKRFGRLLVIERVGSSPKGNALWKCKCDCGTECIKAGRDLVAGSSRSCGCLLREFNHKVLRTHGLSKTKLCYSYWDMKARCYNPNNKGYKNYGERGITVCDEWLNDPSVFFKWAKDNGFQENLTLDRIDVNGNYNPTNCRWISKFKQQGNKRNNHFITFNGETKHLKEWGRVLGINAHTIGGRLRNGWSEERALTQPVKKKKKKEK